MRALEPSRTAGTSATRARLLGHDVRSRRWPGRWTIVAVTAVRLLASFHAARDGMAQEVVLQAHDTANLPAWNSLVLAALANRRANGRNDRLSRLFRDQPVQKDLDTSQAASYWYSHTLQTCDYQWLDTISQLERGRTEAFETIQGWRQMPATAPFQATGILPGDFVLLRDGRSQLRLLVYAGKGRFTMNTKPKPLLQDFFYYSWLPALGMPGDPDYRPGVRKLQLNTYPPTITRDIARQCVSEKTVAKVQQKVFAGKVLVSKVTTSKHPQCNRQSLQRPIGWNQQTSGRSYCVVRMKPWISASSIDHPSGNEDEAMVEKDLRLAIRMAARAAAVVREPTSQSQKLFWYAFGTASPTSQQIEHAAGIYDAFRVHMVKSMIVASAPKDRTSIAHVRKGLRWVVFLDPDYFERNEKNDQEFKYPDDFRASILIHEFCHAWGYSHAGTGNYAGKVNKKLVQGFLKLQGYTVPSSLYQVHRMVSVKDKVQPPECNGFLGWDDAHRNAYSYGNFAYWVFRASGQEKKP